MFSSLMVNFIFTYSTICSVVHLQCTMYIVHKVVLTGLDLLKQLVHKQKSNFL